ncbi:hypothetical protein O4328_29200 [Rhodococcus opacus]|uniref:Uncharacterized protein n=1 Tax=Rhodococcus opacus TaxID=37919 RepID=A0AAX3YS05_RHOOP|nr:hypothetical protein [Rhodococcus opacus]MCZ4587720.1 hypothetical protein [Rhodococcus opacus]WLF51285.1 hypothetical protein Q5707_38640 [Rhodococcus opacus]
MTLLTAFIRSNNLMQELVIASDSRLSGNGQRMDHVQKVFTLPRSDCLLAYAGDTQYAYPLLTQLLLSIDSFPQSRERRLPLGHMQAHILRVFQQSFDAIHGLPVGQTKPEAPDNYFLFGGYDWETNSFRVWKTEFNESAGRFVYSRSVTTGRRQYVFVGDDRAAIKEAYRQMVEMVRPKKISTATLDMEPFEVLSRICADTTYDTIGGIPQFGKVYRHLNSQLFMVQEQYQDYGRIAHIAGRPLINGERNDYPTYTPEVGFFARDNKEYYERVPLGDAADVSPADSADA